MGLTACVAVVQVGDVGQGVLDAGLLVPARGREQVVRVHAREALLLVDDHDQLDAGPHRVEHACGVVGAAQQVGAAAEVDPGLSLSGQHLLPALLGRLPVVGAERAREQALHLLVEILLDPLVVVVERGDVGRADELVLALSACSARICSQLFRSFTKSTTASKVSLGDSIPQIICSRPGRPVRLLCRPEPKPATSMKPVEW